MWDDLTEAIRLLLSEEIERSVILAAAISAGISLSNLFIVRQKYNNLIVDLQDWQKRLSFFLFPRESINTGDGPYFLQFDGSLIRRADERVGNDLNERTLYYFYRGAKLNRHMWEYPRDSWIATLVLVQLILIGVALFPLREAFSEGVGADALKIVLISTQFLPILVTPFLWWQSYVSSNWRREVSQLTTDYDLVSVPGIRRIRME